VVDRRKQMIYDEVKYKHDNRGVHGAVFTPFMPTVSASLRVEAKPINSAVAAGDAVPHQIIS
jgi:hypothetical protein